MRALSGPRRAAALGLCFAVWLSAVSHAQPVYAQADQGTRTVVSGTVLDVNGRPAAGVVIGYLTAEEVDARNVTSARRLVLVNGRRQASAEQRQETAVRRASIRREGYATVTATQTVSSEDTVSEETVTSDNMRRLGLTGAPDMLAQLPSNIGTFELDNNDAGNGAWLIHPSGIAFVDGKPVGETDDAGTFRVELPGGGTYVITARIESPTSRGYGSRQPVVVESGETVQLLPIMLSLSTHSPSQ